MMNSTRHNIVVATLDDLALVCRLFEEAIAFQKSRNYIGWNNYDPAFIRADIEKGLLLKIVEGGDTWGVFSVCFSDPLIWREKEKGDAIYLHRVIVDRAFAGTKIFQKVLYWAREFAIQHSLRYVRMDTWAGNEKIIGYYKSYGFRVIEDYKTGNSPALPVQHRNLAVTLLEYAL